MCVFPVRPIVLAPATEMKKDGELGKLAKHSFQQRRNDDDLGLHNVHTGEKAHVLCRTGTPSPAPAPLEGLA